MAERVDVVIAGSGFGGAVAAYRLAEAYRAAGADPRAIVVLERGRIVEVGRHDELVARGGQYAELFAIQAGAYR